MGEQPANPRRVWLMSTPRSGSHLLVKIFSQQPKLSYSGYNFMNFIFQHHKILDNEVTLDKLDPEDRNAVFQAAEQGLADTMKITEQIEAEGKIPLLKEHVSSILDPFYTCQSQPCAADHIPWKASLSQHALNPTLIPDVYLSSFQPVFLIRHPALAFPSMLHTTRIMMPHITLENKGMTIEMTFKWVRMTYLWFQQAASTGRPCEPIIVDADDVLNNRAVLDKLAVLLGGESDRLLFQWSSVTGAELESKPPFARTFESTLLASEGIVKGKDSKEVTVDREVGKWIEEFGEQTAKHLKGLVQDAMPDYEFLKTRRLTANSPA